MMSGWDGNPPVGTSQGTVQSSTHSSTPTARPPDRPPVPPELLGCSPSERGELRRGAVSGLYEGRFARFSNGGRELHLRLDVDRRPHASSPVLDKISGDFYEYQVVPGGLGRPQMVRTYVESWIVDSPLVRWARSQVEITGEVRYWQGARPSSTIRVVVPWRGGNVGRAQVTFDENSLTSSSFTCVLRSDSFRNVMLEIDHCASVNRAPQVPSYDTHSHPVRPVDTPARALTIADAYREAGVEVTMPSEHTVLDDGAPGFRTWSPAELHDAMETAFDRFPGTWPSWNMWGLLAGSFDNAGTAGIMFDASATYGGAGEGPDRQGFAVFRDHWWFADLVEGTPTTEAQASAMRQFLYTWVHEAGHAFNFVHSWNKARPDSLSWMNYPHQYDMWNGADSFWGSFGFGFDEEELLHIRHGDRSAVIMGGEPWASGLHSSSPSGASAETDPGAAVELLVKAPEYVDLMEPVHVEIRLRNTSRTAIEMDVGLDPQLGSTTVFVRRPDGRTVTFHPVMCQYGAPQTAVLEALAVDGSNIGRDRFSAMVPLTFGSRGFMFDAPGEYLIRCAYRANGMLLMSRTTRMRVGRPMSREEDRLASRWFTREVGLSVALDGSQSPLLAEGMSTLRAALTRFHGRDLEAKVAATVARSVGRDFYRRVDDRLVREHEADPDAALELTRPALELYRGSGDPRHNLAYHRVVDQRSDLLLRTGASGAAVEEALTLAEDLAARGVNPPVISDIRAKAESFA